jgi:hypothetical protein
MDELVKCNEQIRREKDIDKLLIKFVEKDIPDDIIHKINKKYPITKILDFLRTEQLELGFFIKLISLDLKKVYNAVILEIIPNSSHKFGVILVKTRNVFWRIKPDDYYIFKVERDSKKSFKMQNEIKKLKKDNKKYIKK